jgi:hypothetical protein
MAKRKIWPNRKELAQNKENIWRNGSTGFESGSSSAKANDVSSWVGSTRNGIVPCVGWPLSGSRGTKIKTTLKMYVNMLLTCTSCAVTLCSTLFSGLLPESR